MPIHTSRPLPPQTCNARDDAGRQCTLDEIHDPKPHTAVWVEDRVWSMHRWDAWGTVEREDVRFSSSGGGWQKGDKGVLKSRFAS